MPGTSTSSEAAVQLYKVSSDRAESGEDRGKGGSCDSSTTDHGVC